MSDSLGTIFRITSFGESHGNCVGITIEGCPAGLPLTADDIQVEVDRRRPESSAVSTGRQEEDRVEILSGVFNNLTTGAPICMMAWNKDTDSSVYEKLRLKPRPGHADYTSYIKYGGFEDYRGGGRFSGRITTGFVMAGAVALKLLKTEKIEILSYTKQIGSVSLEDVAVKTIRNYTWSNVLRCPDPVVAAEMMKAIDRERKEGDSLGGIVECLALNVPAGLGEPVFDTLEGNLARAMLAIPAVKGVEFGAGFGVAGMKGSENNDEYLVDKKHIETRTNHAGGILGGISNGMPIVVRVAVKPTPSIAKEQQTVDLGTVKTTSIKVSGRHDTCIVPRAVPVVSAMMAVTLADFAIRAGFIPGVIK